MPEITAALRDRGAVVVVAPPGSGKTTRVPPAVLDAGLLGEQRLIILQPRRIAARAAAARIAAERGWTLGDEVGYQVRFENRTGPRTRIHCVTEGILTRRLQGDPFLAGVACVVLDEFHERSLHVDLALALLREVRESARPDLKVAVMSATLDPGPVAAYLGGCPIITAAGRPHPVEVRHRPRPDRSPLAEQAARAVEESWDASRGHVLVFLPGIGEIRRAARALAGFAAGAGAVLAPLHGSMTLDEQEQALAPSTARKIVLATNIAETSLTIEGVDLVIDAGHARVLRNDPRHGIDRLELARISKHAAEQRAGRAGRLGPGTALRLWTLAEHAALAEAEVPEVRRLDLAGAVLELRAWGCADPRLFRWFEAPEAATLARAEETLAALGAIAGERGPLTAVGREMLAIPAHPRLARLLIAGRESGLLAEGAALAALIEERDLLLSPEPGALPTRGSGPARETGPSDLLLRLDRFQAAEERGFRRDGCAAIGVEAQAARTVARARDLLVRSARGGAAERGRRQAGGSGRGPARGARPAPAKEAETSLLRALLLAYPDRVARRRAKGSDRGRLTGGRGVVLAPESIVRDEEFFVAVELDETTRGARGEAMVRLASAVRRAWLEEAFPQAIHEVTDTFFDADTEKVRATVAACYRDLPLEDPREKRPPPDEAERILAAAARPRAEELFAASEEAGRWLARVRSLREWLPELGLPAFGAGELAEAIAGQCAGRTSFAELRAADLKSVLCGMLAHDQATAVERHAPEALAVPSGRRAPLEYQPGRPPVLAARVQELFGLADTPTVAGGRVKVLVHILGPNQRPVQVTQDLRSFWTTTYAQVRKDLRARYPRHAWPEDPWTAQAEARPRRRR